ncbi:MAG: SUF system NifU family Fe-S cluster assembly protein [Candidatus Woykebacteria bacterium RBG_16_43_9]|uniref:SUF system NifU family Fe-S cluster assembly protein n=1 Tax=Candidatus Woykebacteria bacterium RBG_16_43_9 TaxID=1802596 RepID=A0A1G1WDA8_9BACT|nr:MAG: SUF system NifU family Fe-S cluster assembly protein [Candidatus Woykebacteria bacterium RBG_16_43_9]
MEEQLYREALLEIYRNPTNRREITKPDLEAKLVNPLCGDEVKLQIKLEKGTVKKAAFSGNGCAISQASASLLAESIQGKKLSDVNKLRGNDILELIGINPSPSRVGCALLSLEVLMEALKSGSKS